MDPTKELSRLIAEQKYEEAFTLALHRSDVSIVSWLCSQVCSVINCRQINSNMPGFFEVLVDNLGLVSCVHVLSHIERLAYMCLYW